MMRCIRPALDKRLKILILSTTKKNRIQSNAPTRNPPISCKKSNFEFENIFCDTNAVIQNTNIGAHTANKLLWQKLAIF